MDLAVGLGGSAKSCHGTAGLLSPYSFCRTAGDPAQMRAGSWPLPANDSNPIDHLYAAYQNLPEHPGGGHGALLSRRDA